MRIQNCLQFASEPLTTNVVGAQVCNRFSVAKCFASLLQTVGAATRTLRGLNYFPFMRRPTSCPWLADLKSRAYDGSDQTTDAVEIGRGHTVIGHSSTFTQ